jgi:hypothetical protein
MSISYLITLVVMVMDVMVGEWDPSNDPTVRVMVGEWDAGLYRYIID